MELAEELTRALVGRYAIEGVIGSGGMATVYLAHDVKHDRRVAVKVLHPELAAVLGAQRFLAEIKITARLDHPHIVTLIDSGAVDGILFYVLPFVRGESLRKKLTRERQLGIDEAIRITKQIAGALDYAHRHGIIHRDIKPENILLQEDEAMLADFGIALAVEEAAGNRLTATGLSPGTPQYMSPEQASGDRLIDARSDVYSLGAVLYEMLAGEPPVTGANPQAMIARIMTEKPRSLRVIRSAVADGLEAAVMKALDKTPADRFASAAEFARVLEMPNMPSPRARTRRRALLLTGGVAILALTAVGGYFVARDRSTLTFQGAIPIQLTTSGRAPLAVPSPDGSQLAYAEQHCDGPTCLGTLVIRETAGDGVSTIVSQPGRLVYPGAWSPDGHWLAFFAGDPKSTVDGGAYLVSQRGGTPRRIVSGLVSFVAPDTALVTSMNGTRFWLRRVAASTSVVIDSVELPGIRPVGGIPPDVLVSPTGRWLLSILRTPWLRDTSIFVILDRSGRAIDSLRQTDFTSVLWQAGSNALLFASTARGESKTGMVVARRTIDAHGRISRSADTIAAIPGGDGTLLGMSADATQLFYQMALHGETSLWTATRSAENGPFARGRRFLSSTASLKGFFAGSGEWMLIEEAAGANSGSRVARSTLESFDGTRRHVLDPALRDVQGYAFSPRGDSVAIATGAGPGRVRLSVYPIAPGAPTLRGVYPGQVSDLEWLFDGRLASPANAGKSVRIFESNGQVRDVRLPDSLGTIAFTAASPRGSELAVLTVRSGFADPALLGRLNLTDGRWITLARPKPQRLSNVWWTSDGYVHASLDVGSGFGLHRVKVTGGALELEPPISSEPDAEVVAMSPDGRRVILGSQHETTDTWVLRATRRK